MKTKLRNTNEKLDNILKKGLFFKLVLPLILISIATSVLAFKVSQSFISGFLANIATEIMGIIVTVWYVDKIIKSYEKSRWNPVHSGVIRRVQKFYRECLEELIGIISTKKMMTLAHVLGAGLTLYLDQKLFEQPKLRSICLERFSIGRSLNTKDADIVSGRELEGYTLVDLFGSQMEPDELNDLLDFLEGLESVKRVQSKYQEATAASNADTFTDLILHLARIMRSTDSIKIQQTVFPD